MLTFDRDFAGTRAEGAAVAALIDSIAFVRALEGITEIAVRIYPPPAEPSPVRVIQGTWLKKHLPEVDTPGGLPRASLDRVCPAGSRLVEIELIRRRERCMSSYYDHIGYFLSLVVTPDLTGIIDARGEEAG